MQLKTEAFDFTFAKMLSFRTLLDKLYDTTTRILNESMDDYFWLVSILLATYDHPLNKKIKTVSNQIAQALLEPLIYDARTLVLACSSQGV